MRTRSLYLPLLLVACAGPVMAQTWTYKQPAPTWFFNHVAGTGPDSTGTQRVYVIGGTKVNSSGGTIASAAVYGYNPVSNIWNSYASMPTPRADATATSLNGKIYVIGGLQVGFSNGLSTVEAYDTAANNWITRASLPVPAVRAASAAYGGKLYVFGGYQPNSGIELKSTYEYNPTTNLWIQRLDMPGPIHDMGAVTACNGKIYVIGSGVNYEYTVATNTWATRTPAPQIGVVQKGRGLVIGSDQSIYLVNDRNYFTGSDPVVYAYSFVSDIWYQAPNTITGYSSNAAVHLNGYLYTVGGYTKFTPATNRLQKSSVLGSCSCFTFKGKPALLCSSIKNVDIKATDTGPFQSTPDGVRLVNPEIGHPAVDLGSALTTELEWQPMKIERGTRLTLNAEGLVNRKPNQPAGTLTFSLNRGANQIEANFNQIRATRWRVEVSNDGKLVNSLEGKGGVIALQSTSSPSNARITRSTEQQVAWSTKFEKATEIKVGDLKAVGNEVRITAQSSLTVDYFSRLAFTASNLKEMIISNVDITPSGGR